MKIGYMFGFILKKWLYVWFCIKRMTIVWSIEIGYMCAQKNGKFWLLCVYVDMKLAMYVIIPSDNYRFCI